MSSSLASPWTRMERELPGCVPVRSPYMLTVVQRCASQLPRGWCDSICHALEARSEGGEGIEVKRRVRSSTRHDTWRRKSDVTTCICELFGLHSFLLLIYARYELRHHGSSESISTFFTCQCPLHCTVETILRPPDCTRTSWVAFCNAFTVVNLPYAITPLPNIPQAL